MRCSDWSSDVCSSDLLTVTSITGYSDLDFLNATDGDGMALEGLDLGRDKGRIKSFTQEVRLANAASNPLRFVIGANYERTTANEDIELYNSGPSRSEEPRVGNRGVGTGKHQGV